MTSSSPVTAKKSMRINLNPRTAATSMTLLKTRRTSWTEADPAAVATKKSSCDDRVSCIGSMASVSIVLIIGQQYPELKATMGPMTQMGVSETRAAFEADPAYLGR